MLPAGSSTAAIPDESLSLVPFVMGIRSDLLPGESIAIGILVGLLSTSVQSLGLTLQRKSHLLEDEKDPYTVRRPPYRRRRWQLGMAMFIISNLVGCTIQITTLPLPVLSTLQASGLVFNSMCATLILGEPFTRWSLSGTLLISTGAVMIAIYGAIPEPAHSLDQLLFLLAERNFVIWMILQAITVTGIVTMAGLLSRIPSLSAKPRIRLLLGLAYGGISGILSAHSLLVAKSAVELLVLTILHGVNQFNRWQSWVVLFGLVFLALTQLYYLHSGLKLISTSLLYPLVFCVYNIIAILDGLIYFKQTDRLNPLRASLIASGTIILLSGVLALSWRLSDEQTQPAVAKSALAPGLGFVEDTDSEEYPDSLDADVESVRNTENQPLLNGASTSYTIKPNSINGATCLVRDPVVPKKSDQIWKVLGESWTKLNSSALPVPAIAEQMTSTSSTNLNRSKRRRSSGFPGFTARPSPRIPKKDHPRSCVGHRSQDPQD